MCGFGVVARERSEMNDERDEVIDFLIKIGADMEEAKTLFGKWQEMSGLIPDEGEDEGGSGMLNSRFEDALDSLGLSVKTLMPVAIKLGFQKGEDTQEAFSIASLFCAAFLFGALMEQEKRGEDPFGKLRSMLPKPKTERKKKE